MERTGSQNFSQLFSLSIRTTDLKDPDPELYEFDGLFWVLSLHHSPFFLMYMWCTLRSPYLGWRMPQLEREFRAWSGFMPKFRWWLGWVIASWRREKRRRVRPQDAACCFFFGLFFCSTTRVSSVIYNRWRGFMLWGSRLSCVSPEMFTSIIRK